MKNADNFYEWAGPSQVANLWRKIKENRDGCWLWTGETDDNCYPRFSVVVDGKQRKLNVKRLMKTKEHGGPPENLIKTGRRIDACHTCTSRECVNPFHLVWDTHRENTRQTYSTDTDGKRRRKAYPGAKKYKPRVKRMYPEIEAYMAKQLAEYEAFMASDEGQRFEQLTFKQQKQELKKRIEEKQRNLIERTSLPPDYTPPEA